MVNLHKVAVFQYKIKRWKTANNQKAIIDLLFVCRFPHCWRLQAALFRCPGVIEGASSPSSFLLKSERLDANCGSGKTSQRLWGTVQSTPIAYSASTFLTARQGGGYH